MFKTPMNKKEALYIGFIAAAFMVVIVSFGFICGEGEEGTRHELDNNDISSDSLPQSNDSPQDSDFLNSVRKTCQENVLPGKRADEETD